MVKYILREGKKEAVPLLLLHGTGGDEYSMLEIAQLLSPDSTIISMRGAVSENGANRFFRRFSEGSFDYESLELEADQLLSELRKIIQPLGIALADLVVVGYSNGANIAAHIALERKESFKRLVLFHGMSLDKHIAEFILDEINVFLSVGLNDPIVTKANTDQLIEVFKKRHAEIDVFFTNQGHQLVYDEVIAAKEWLMKHDSF